jgi:hypothetical protein
VVGWHEVTQIKKWRKTMAQAQPGAGLLPTDAQRLARYLLLDPWVSLSLVLSLTAPVVTAFMWGIAAPGGLGVCLVGQAAQNLCCKSTLKDGLQNLLRNVALGVWMGCQAGFAALPDCPQTHPHYTFAHDQTCCFSAGSPAPFAP